MGKSASYETGGGAAPVCSCCTDSHTKCTLSTDCAPSRMQRMSCYKFVTFDWLMLKVNALACPTSELFIRTNFGQKILEKDLSL